MSYLAAARAQAAKEKASAYATATAALTAATAAVKAGAAPSVSAALAKQAGKYRYEWTWEWHAWQRLTAMDVSKLTTQMEKKLREKLTQEKEVTKIESMTTTVIKTWNEWVLGIYHHHVRGVTKTVFLSTAKQASPPIPIAIIVVAVAAVLIAALICVSIVTIANLIKEVPEVAEAVEAAAEALPYFAVGGTVVVLALAGLYLWSKRKK